MFTAIARWYDQRIAYPLWLLKHRTKVKQVGQLSKQHETTAHGCLPTVRPTSAMLKRVRL